MTDIVERLRSAFLGSGTGQLMHEAAAEIKRLQAENEDLRRWKAMDKPVTAAMTVVNNDVVALRTEIERLQRELTRALAEIEWLRDVVAAAAPAPSVPCPWVPTEIGWLASGLRHALAAKELPKP